MASLCQKNRKKSCSTSHIQDTKLFIFFRKLCLDLLHPAVRHRTVKLRTPLFQKAVASLFPVVNDTLFALIIATYNTSIGHHRTISNHLKRARLIQDHPVKLRLTDFLNLAFIVTDFTQDIALLDHVTDLFKRIPEPVFFRILIAHICHLERIIRTKILQSLIDSHVTQNIPDVSSSRTDLLVIPVAHAATLDQDTRDSLRSRIIIRTTRSHVGLYHIWHIHLLRHLTRNLNHILRCSSRIIHIRSQLLIIISTVQINIIIRYRLEFLGDCPRKTLHLRSTRISRKFTVQILIIRESHTSITRLKSRTVQHLHDNDRTGDLLNLKLLRKLDRRLNSHILTRMHPGCDQHCLACSMAMKYCCRKFKFPVCKLQFSVPLLTRFYGNIFQMKRISLSACQKKDRRRTIVNDLFFRPDLFPDIFITKNIQKTSFFHRIQIPLRTFQTT